MLEPGFIRHSSSIWASPLLLVPKRDLGDWRPCGNYHALNVQTVHHTYPLSHMLGFTSSLTNTNMFSKTDLVKAYHQIPVKPSGIRKMAITSPTALFEYIRMKCGSNVSMLYSRSYKGCAFHVC